jgi:hypothetical protein
VSTGPVYPSLHIDRAGVIRPDLIPLAAFLCAEEYDDYARSIILDHAAAGAPLADLTVATPDGWVVLEPIDLAGAQEALCRGGPAPRVEENPAPAPVSGGAPAPVSGGAPAAADPVAAVDGRPTTLAETVDHEALAYRAWGTPEGDFLARQMERLSQLVRWTGAVTPEDHEARMEVWEEDRRRQWEDRGHAAGLEQGRREGRDLAFEEIRLVLRRSVGR